MISEDEVFELLKSIIDPELNQNIVDLGLVYDVTVKNDEIYVLMTLTTPACPVGPEIIEKVQSTLKTMPGIRSVDFELTFDPMWGIDMINEDIRAEMGIEDY